MVWLSCLPLLGDEVLELNKRSFLELISAPFEFVSVFFFPQGSIDEVEQMVHMTWVQPRVLDLNQVSCLFVLKVL